MNVKKDNFAEIYNVLPEATQIIKTNSMNSFLALELLIKLANKYSLPDYVGYGIFCEIKDIALLESQTDDNITNEHSVNIIKQSNENKFIKLTNSIMQLSNVINLKNTTNELSLQFIKSKCLERLKLLIDSSTGVTDINTTDYNKDFFRDYVDNTLRLPKFVSTGIITELFYMIFTNSQIKVTTSVFEKSYDSSAFFSKNLRNFAYDTLDSLLNLYRTYTLEDFADIN